MNLFGLIVVETGPVGVAHPRYGDDTTRVEHPVSADDQTTIRFNDARLVVFVSATPGCERPGDTPGVPRVSVQLKHARVVDLSETAVVVEGMEEVDFTLTGRVARVTLTVAGTGW